MPYDPIEGQGHGGPKVAKMTNFKVYLLRWYALTMNYDAPRQCLNFSGLIFDILPHSASRDLQR